MVKAAVLQRKTYAFAMPNRNYRFSSELSLQNHRYFAVSKKLHFIWYNGQKDLYLHHCSTILK